MSEKSYSKRSANFNSCEIDFLIKTVTKFRDIIESKKIDRASAEEKTKAWKEVERLYNSQFEYNFRSVKVLKTKYDNLKKNAKKILRQRDSDWSLSTKSEVCPSKQELEEIAFMDETTFSNDRLLSETVREYFEENFPENDNTSQSWHADEIDEADDTDEQTEAAHENEHLTTSNSLLEPMLSNTTFQNSQSYVAPPNGINKKRFSENGDKRLEGAKRCKTLGIQCTKNISACSSTNQNVAQKKSSIQLFCDSLAIQIEEAQLSRYQLSSLQIDLLKKLQEYIPHDK